jgi:dihydroorotate dehydrogenase electron transfer subunit
MVWLPGAGEFPMSLSLPRKGLCSIGVKAMGTGSKLLYETGQGAIIGIRGPYGAPFDLERISKKKRVLIAGGGTGLVPMLVLAKALSKLNMKANAVISARTSAELPFLKSFSKYHKREDLYVTTDDGTLGYKGMGHEKVREIVKEQRIDEIFSCGPERMMAEIYKIAKRNSIPVQFSLERIMKCGIGICGSCTIGDVVLCKDGPVLNEEQLSRLGTEFGLSKRDATGTLCPI